MLQTLRRYSTMLPSIIEKHRPSISPELDYSTFSNYQKFQIRHTDLKIKVCFDKSTVSGAVEYDIASLDETNKEITLDTSFLDVSNVEINNESAKFSIGERTEPLGAPLKINAELPREFKLKLNFSTTAQCTALQWLTGEQTSGKPYMFSQLEAIHARSLFPCFDSPSVKSTFSAAIESTLPVVSSGIHTKTEENIYHFEQRVPIPCYLIGIASGDLASAEIGPRSTIYTEPFRLQDAKNEFQDDVEKFIQIAENIIFKYEWGTYDILINPNSYPYGGMESPNMTFATPTLIAYDKSNIDVIAHELAHSWAGNLVTNCSWDHFWLNEGWTVYLERRIIGSLYSEQHRHFSAIIGWNDLEEDINAMPNPERFSCLIQNLKDGADPDDAFSSVPYEKGFNLLFHLEQVLGGVAEFDPFIKHYFTKFAKKSLDSYQFLDTLYEFYPHKKDILDNVDWKTWLYTPGMPPKPKFDTSLADEVYTLVDKWVKARNGSAEDFTKQFNASDLADLSSNQLVLLLDTLVEKRDFKWAEFPVAVESLLSIYSSLSESKNAEVIFRLYRFKVQAGLEKEQLAEWLGTVGRMKFVRPGFRLLNKVDRKLALATFEKWGPTYHPICRSLVKSDLGL